MTNLKSGFSLKSLVVLFVVIASAVAFSSCKDDKDKDEPSGSNSLVGTWYFSGDGGLDYNDVFSFKSNGTVTYSYYEESVTGKYTYDAGAGYVTLAWNDPEWGTERISVRFISENIVVFGGGDYGQYTRR